MTVVLIIRGLGARWLGCYGNEWVATPNFDRLAAGGVVHDECYAEKVTPVQPPADATVIRAGQQPLSTLKLPKSDGLIWIESDALLPPWRAPAELFEDYFEGDGEPVTEPQDGDDWEQVHASFAAAMTMLDAEVGALIDSTPATWILTSDGGFPLGEHDIVGRAGGAPHEELVHVPLIVGYEDGRDAGSRLSALTTPGDILAIVRGEPLTVRSEIKSTHDDATAIRTADWTLIRRGEKDQLFHRPEDRNEVNDVARAHSDVVEALA